MSEMARRRARTVSLASAGEPLGAPCSFPHAPPSTVGTHEEVRMSINEDAYDVIVVGSGGG
ncbi:hypothetical protein, partial [Streptomyces sp. NPDC088357]|uniref:hypothetical protein n=1 Tax=Streptomyces sp. NPDC088357 TaxID=3154655 RepID=UPI00341D5683